MTAEAVMRQNDCENDCKNGTASAVMAIVGIGTRGIRASFMPDAASITEQYM